MAARLTIILGGLFLWAVKVSAGMLDDPTAPPVAAASQAGGAHPVMQLTAIKLIGKRRTALIGGQEVSVGGRYQDARVVTISDSEVVLRRGNETTVLKLYPQVDKRLRKQ